MHAWLPVGVRNAVIVVGKPLSPGASGRSIGECTDTSMTPYGVIGVERVNTVHAVEHHAQLVLCRTRFLPVQLDFFV